MKVYKDHQYLVFDFENGQMVKYDFATKRSYGKSGLPVKDLKTQLRGISLEDVFGSCTDLNYAYFLRFVRSRGGANGCPISNIGTILGNVPMYSHYEQLFSAGIRKIEYGFQYDISDIPSGLLKICRKHGFRLSEKLLLRYKSKPNAFKVAFDGDYLTLTSEDIFEIFIHDTSRYRVDNRIMYGRNRSTLLDLIDSYGYNAKSLYAYIDHLKTFEGITNISVLIGEIQDYASMMSEITNKYDRYPKHFLTTHRIAVRNYERLRKQYDESSFAGCVKPEMECVIGDYAFIYPKSTEAIKDEAVQQNHCVSAYIDRVINGACDILFMRHKNCKDVALVTLEVVDGKVVQARQRFNHEITIEQRIAIDKWNKWYKKKVEGLIHDKNQEGSYDKAS